MDTNMGAKLHKRWVQNMSAKVELERWVQNMGAKVRFI